MRLHRPKNIPKLSETDLHEEITDLLNSFKPYESKNISQKILHFLSESYSSYPIIPVPDKYQLLVIEGKNSAIMIWISGWFEVISAFRNTNKVHSVCMRINGNIIETDYDTLYPKDISLLTKYGLIMDIDYAGKLSKYIFKCIAGLSAKEKINAIGFMVQGSELLFRGYDEEPQILMYTEGVTIVTYVEILNPLLTNSALMFALCCSCASLFLAYLSMVCGIPLMSFIISFYGRSTTGKSTAQTLMASVFTDPKDKKLYIPFFGTLNAIVKNLTQKFGVPQLFDEATVASGVNMEDLLYMITLEQDKNRCNSNSELRIPDTWKLIAITSSENRLLSKSRMHNRGLDARLLSFELKFTDNREHSDAIHGFCNRYYGILGKALSEQLLCADRDAITQQYDECKETMRNVIDDIESFDLAERLINEYAVILLAGKTLVELGVNIDINGIVAIMAENCNSIREITDIAEKYYQHLISYAILHPYAEGIKKDEQTNTTAFIDEIFLRIIESYGASNPELVIKELDAAGYIFRRRTNSLKNRLRFNGVLANCYEIILPASEAESDENHMTLEYILTHFEGIDES